jgi:RNA polymerase sigma-70 factor, ECF subfamily
MQLYQQLSDNELMAHLRNGDELAFAEVYRRYIGLLQTHAYKKLGDLDEAKDVLQDLFTHLWNKHADLPETVNLSGYLYQGMRNRILNIFAHRTVQEKYTATIAQFVETGSYSTDARVRERELAAVIEKEINLLPAKMRQVFLLSRQEHLTHFEIAQRLSISEQTVSKQVTNALKVLRLRMGSLFVLALFIAFK